MIGLPNVLGSYSKFAVMVQNPSDGNKEITIGTVIGLLLVCCGVGTQPSGLSENTYNIGKLKPFDSKPKVKSGQMAPDFTLPSVSGEKITLSKYKDKKNVVISFVPAAYTPVCSDQWPGYNIAKDEFEQGDAVLLGIF